MGYFKMYLTLALVVIACVDLSQTNRVVFPPVQKVLEAEEHTCAVAHMSGGLGEVYFTQIRRENVNLPVLVKVNLRGLTPGKHGFHIHQFGTTENKCLDAKGHFNPLRQTHGDKSAPIRHVGDLGNIVADSKGVSKVKFTDKHISLSPHSIANIIGRAVVVHEGEDDLGLGGDEGSLKTGNAGGRVGCGVIGYCDCKIATSTVKARYAMATLAGPSPVTGTVVFSQEDPDAAVIVRGVVYGLNESGSDLRGFHVHEFGDTSDDCLAAGDHFNPTGVNHAGPDDEIRHVGDLGNIQQGVGETEFCIIDSWITLFPDENSIVGRSIVLHEYEDDLGLGGDPGSIANGNAGPRLACGVIGVIPDMHYISIKPDIACIDIH